MHEDDATCILQAHWARRHIFLQLHKWYIDFNPVFETPSSKYVWVKLSSLSIESRHVGFWWILGIQLVALCIWMPISWGLGTSIFLGFWLKVISRVAS